jgi:hypothetical protein
MVRHGLKHIFQKPTPDIDSSDRTQQLRSKTIYAGTVNLAQTLAQGSNQRYKTYNGPYEVTSHNLIASHSYDDMLSITKGKVLLNQLPLNSNSQDYYQKNFARGQMYEGNYNQFDPSHNFVGHTGCNNSVLVYDIGTTGFTGPASYNANGGFIGATGSQDNNKRIFIDPNHCYYSDPCLLDASYTRFVAPVLGTTGPGQFNAQQIISADQYRGFSYPMSNFDLRCNQQASDQAIGPLFCPPEPENIAHPVIIGSSLVGSVLSVVSNGTWYNSPTSFTYQWYSGATPIPSQTTTSYTTQQTDIGLAITCQVVAINAGGSSAPATSNSIIMVPPSIILEYNANQGPSFVWSGVSFTLDATLPNYSYTAITTSIPASQVPGFSQLTQVTIDSSVTSIGNYAFKVCTALTSVTIGSSVTSIGANAFQTCSALTSITIPNSVTSIGTNVFSVCTALTSVTIGNSVTSISSAAFSSCTALTSVIIPNSVTSIGTNAFNECYALTSITIPNSVTSIGTTAFTSCTALTFVTIGSSVTSIGNFAFYNCSALTSVIIPNSVISIGNSAFQSCVVLTSVTIGSSVTSIGNSVFQGCTTLSSVTIGSSVATISNSAFQSCVALASITIPNSVTSIGDSAFQGCTTLSSVTIGSSVATIGIQAFYACSQLASITIPDSVTSIGQSAFQLCTALTSVTIPNSVTSIGINAFSFSGLTFVIIPKSVFTISQGAFASCSSLTSVTFILPSIITVIRYAVFSSSGLTSITVPNSVTTIELDAFSSCAALTSVTIPSSVTSVGDNAFLNSGLTNNTLTIPTANGLGISSSSPISFFGATNVNVNYTP